ncbi:DEAD/DEAH box helicase [Mycobacterium dioxanotrophicus]|uniref:DEAD/DEAH box helicase n=1 Tax=Mycobacterium dioxanotrophicus TaxID=482462 RepID=UPI0018E03C2F|nr:DEAD/DEAH box helicase [Mycobacterium dioxanotrophicus]
MSTYVEFLAAKAAAAPHDGRTIPVSDVHPSLHRWQAEIVQWAVGTSRAAIWADTGLGKTRMQLEWARITDGFPIVIAPLAVCRQTIREAEKLGIAAQYVRSTADVNRFKLSVTNYERVDAIDPGLFDSVVLDESSILKQSDGATRTALIEWASTIPHRLACSATPAPNDPEELTNQAEWLGRMTRTHMLAAYFVHDQDGWRIKGHAGGPMVDWMTSWAVALRRPSDMGGDDTGYILPGLDIVPHLVESRVEEDGALFAVDLGGVTGRSKVRKQTLDDRVAVAAELVAAEPDEPWLLWCALNAEAEALADAIPGAVNVHGALHPDQKADALMDFADGGFRVLITKPQIASQGLNYQHCARMAFVGLGDSYEQYYQAIRRCYRYGQSRIVQAHIILSDLESQIATNVARKERQANLITDALIAARKRSVA